MSKPYTLNPLMEGFWEDWFVTSDGVNLRYLQKGIGKPLLLLHGWADAADAFSLNAPAFAENYAVYAIDLRGQGYSQADHGARMARIAADINEFICSMLFDKVSILGHSMGCASLWSYLDLYGEGKIDKLIFADQCPRTLGNPQDTYDEMRLYGGVRMDLPYYYDAICHGWDKFREALPTCYDKILMAQSYPPNSLPNRFTELFAQIPECPPMDMKFLAELVWDHSIQDWRDLFATIESETLLVSGDLSYITTPECCAWMASQMKNCKWVRFSQEEYGIHSMLQANYRKFNDSVLDFLR